MKKRCSGILMPVSSLPGGYGIGSMGQAARDFVDFLVLAGQSVWQILPLARLRMATARTRAARLLRATRILLIWRSWWKPGF